MADSKGPTEKAAEKQARSDPTVSSRSVRSGWADGTHPAVSPSKQSWGPHRFTYSDMPAEDKPDPSTVAQIVEADPLLEQSEQAIRKDAQ